MSSTLMVHWAWYVDVGVDEFLLASHELRGLFELLPPTWAENSDIRHPQNLAPSLPPNRGHYSACQGLTSSKG
ncbi:hypothetical protein E2C01_051417 [Portunus trituberculatus]|uniref:Uncharacterized protein n=1 Tax=Portunus trituberculatus TaxID=210409 RepID=A0A5B7GJI0_PORTR|nr:hypothetical protein [Portunus trituberculatus]